MWCCSQCATVQLNEYGLPFKFNRLGQLRSEALAKIEREVVRFGNNGTRQGFKFAQKMVEKYPEMKGA